MVLRSLRAFYIYVTSNNFQISPELGYPGVGLDHPGIGTEWPGLFPLSGMIG